MTQNVILPLTPNPKKGQVYWHPGYQRGYVFDGKVWIEASGSTTIKFPSMDFYSKYRDPATGILYENDGVRWIPISMITPNQVAELRTYKQWDGKGLRPDPVTTIGTSGRSFKEDFEMFKAEWMGANPDGWWPEPYEEDQAWAELEASHELMRKWCEENSK